MIFEFRDFVLSLFTLREDTDLHNYSVRLVQMKKKYNNLLYGCDELLTFVLNYIQDKYGMSQNANNEWDVSVKNIVITIDKIFIKIRKSLIEEIIKLEKVENQNKIQEETQEQDITEEQKKQKTLQKYESHSHREIIQIILSKDSKNKLAMVAMELLEFKNRNVSQKIPLQSVPIVKKLMRFEMKSDKEHVRLSHEFKIFREMTEKSILRTIYFYHKRDSSPYEWRKFDPGVLDYSWTGSTDPNNFKVIFEEEFEEEEEQKKEKEEEDLDQEMETNNMQQKQLPIQNVTQDMPVSGVDNGNLNEENKIKFKMMNPIGNENGNNTLKIVIQPINGKKGFDNSDNHNEETGTKFKFTLRKGPMITQEPKLENSNKIEEESGPIGKGFHSSTNVVESSDQTPITLPDLKPIGKGLVSLNNNQENSETISPKIQDNKLQIEEPSPNFNSQPSLLNFIDSESIPFIKQTYLKMTGKIPKLYLIKWKNMSYNQCTWEATLDLESISLKIEDFQKHNRALDKDHRSQALDKKRSHRRVLDAMNKVGYQRRPGGYHSVYNDYYRVLYKEMNSDTKLSMNVIRSLNNTFKGQRALKKYQVESLMWMIERRRKRKNFILADEMGLGKTIQSMAFCLFLKAIEKLDGPFLIVAPLSTLPHWKKTFEEWTSLNVILYHDNESKLGRERCRDLEWYQKDIRLTGEFSSDSKICKFHVIITSFEVFSQDVTEFVDNLCIQHIIIDEAHRLKNQNAKVIKVFQRLPCKRISLLTGTPIQNNINELWSLLNFIEPIKFNDPYEFERNFKDIRSKEQLMHLKEILEPYMIRRMKNEVETIPPLEETLLEIDLTNFQKVSYKTLYEKNKGTLERGRGLGYLTSMNNLEMQLRKCCNHPFLIREIHDKVSGEVYTQQDYVRKMLDYSSKMIVLDKLITKYKKEHKKMLIFSQFTEMLKLIEEFLGFRKIMYKKIDGATKARDRQNAIEAFNSNPDVFEIFLLSTKAGGLGINLTSANVVLIYDSDWNPQNDVQAIARAHRIGQKAEVKVYRLISKMTYEAEMYRRASKKLGLDQAVFLSNQNDNARNQNRSGPHGQTDQRKLTIDGNMLTTNWMIPGNQTSRNSKAPKISDKDLELLLKKGILGLLDEDENKTGEAHAMDIDELIKNSKRTNYSMINDKYTITRMKIETENKDEKVDINDPNFWTKVLKDEETPGKKLLKEFNQLKENNHFMDESTQNDYFKKLNEQIYSYVEKAKKGEVNYDEEQDYNTILKQINDDPFVREDLRNVALLLMGDIRKKPRRLKKRDITGRKRVTKKPKKIKVEEVEDDENKKVVNMKKEEEEFIIEEVKTNNANPKTKKDNKKKKKSKNLNKRPKMEDEGLYRNSDSEDNQSQLTQTKKKTKKSSKKKTKSRSVSKSTSKKKKKLKRVKGAEKSVNMNAVICIFCKSNMPLTIANTSLANTNDPNSNVNIPSLPQVIQKIECCVSCKKTFHINCFQKHLHSINQDSSIGLCNTLKNHLNKGDVPVFHGEDKKCFNCIIGLMDCFVCKTVGKVNVKVDSHTEKNVKEAILNAARSMQKVGDGAFLYEELDSDDVYKCKYCGRHLHLACTLRESPHPHDIKHLINQSSQFICPAHKCRECPKSNTSTICLRCSVGLHRKCLSKTTQRLNNKFFLCQEHQDQGVLGNLPNLGNVNSGVIALEDPGHMGKFSIKFRNNSCNMIYNNPAKPKKGKSRTKKPKQEMSVENLKSLYKAFNLEYMTEMDYENYQMPWCRFCGARYSPQFHDTLLGSKTLCDRHFKAMEKGKIQILKLRGLRAPLKPSENKEVWYMKKAKKEQKKIRKL